MSSKLHRVAVLLFVFLAGTATCFPQRLVEIAKVSLKSQEVEIAPDGKGSVVVQMNVKNGWWSYGTSTMVGPDGIGPQSTTFSVISPTFLKSKGKVKVSKIKKQYDPNFEVEVEKVIGHADFTVPLSVTKAAKPGKHKVAMEIYYMACDSSRCLNPEADTLRFTVIVPENMGAIEDDEAMGDASTDSAAAAVASVDNSTPTIMQDNVSSVGGKAAASTAAVGVSGVAQTESQMLIEKEKEKGLWGFFLFAMLQGALALLTPCVFPMIPITVSFFTKRAEKQNHRWHGIRDSFVYSLGIIFTFVGLGVVVAAIAGGTGIGEIAASPIVNIAIAAVFFMLALNLFGVYEIRVPSSILNKLNARSNQGNGITSVLLMGVVFTLTSFTCTVPFVGFVLSGVSQGEFLYPVVGMLGFSTVFAAPFFLLALFPTAMAALPKAGGWMNNVKVVMGFLEVAFALKFISNADLVLGWGILPREMFLGLWIACGLLIVLYILGLFHLPHDSKVQSVGAPRLLFSIVFAGMTFYLLSGLYGRPLGEIDAFLPPQNYQQIIEAAHGGAAAASAMTAPTTNMVGESTTAADDHKSWIMSYEEGLRIAQETGKPVFIDFTGFTCTNCRWMEANIFPHDDVRALMNGMVKVQLYTDRREEPYISNKKLQQQRFGSLELPLYVILTPKGELIASKAFTRNKQEFIDFLKKAS